jgi:SNF2 family DNA or RNA helicase
MDLYTQCEFLKKGLLGFDNFYTFQLRYAKLFRLNLPGNRYRMIENGFKNLHELEEKIKHFSYRKRKEECLDLPPKVYQKRYIELSKEQRQYYNQLKEYSRAILEDDMVSYNNKLTEIIKLQQICNGFMKTDSGEIIKLKDPKLQELFHILDEHDGKVIIWSSFVYNIEQIEKELQKTYGQESVVTIYGSVSVEKRKNNVKAFQTNSKVKYFVGNPTTGGYGLNLTKATLVIYYNNSFNLEVRMQSEDRAYRHGQTKEVTVLDLIAKDTIDEFVVENLKGKAKLSAQTLGEEALKFL